MAAKDLEHIVIDAGVPGPVLLISAGVHGDEYEPILAVRELARTAGQKIQKGKLVMVPIVNLSAYAINSRYGEDGLDLARVCPGSNDGSVTEQHAAAISVFISGADYYIDLHTGGRVFNIFPLAGYMLHNSEEVLRKQQMMAEAFNLPVVWGTDAAMNGRTLSVARDAAVPAIYVEYGGGQQASRNVTQAYVQGCLNVMAQLGMMEKNREMKSDVHYMVEDYRLNQGHLQSKMPSPSHGIFIPSVELGQMVKAQQEWGKVIDPVNNTEHTVYSDHDGLVLFLRVESNVDAGDSLGGTLPVIKPGKIVYR